MVTNYKEVAKELGCSFRIGRWGFANPMKLVRYYIMRLNGRYDYPIPLLHIPLDGWTTDPNKIIEALANDPAFSIKYGEIKN